MQRLQAQLNAGIDEGLHLGAQAYVSIEGEPIAQLAVGTRDGTHAMALDTPMLWMSAGKPLTAVAIGQLVEAGELDWDEAVYRLVPGFEQGGKQSIQIRHLLTHTAGLVEPPNATQAQDWHDFALAACAASIKPGGPPGSAAAYSPHANWAILGLILERLTGHDFSSHLTNRVLNPIGGERTWCGIPDAEFDRYGDVISVMHDTARRPGEPIRARPIGWHERAYATQPRPGANTYATAADLGRFYENLLAGGGQVLQHDTVNTMTARQRRDRFDATFRHVIDFGYGFLLNSWHHGPDTVPYGYGEKASPATFGHSGSQSTVAFADPQSRLVVAIACNGMPGEPRHQKRLRRWLHALEADLDMA